MIFDNEGTTIYSNKRTLPFNESGFVKAIQEIAFGDKKRGCSLLKDELNNFFKNSGKCRSCQYTLNTDNDFFGIYIKPINNYNLVGFANGVNHHLDNDFNIDCYAVELDSQLIDCITYNEFDNYKTTLDIPHLNELELITLLLHDVNEILGFNATDKVSNAIQAILAFSDDTIDPYKIEMTSKLFDYAIIDTCRGLTSVFCKRYEDCFANEFIRTYGLTTHYDNAIYCINRLKGLFHEDLAISNIMVLNWYMNNYKKIVDDHIRNNPYIIGVLTKGVSYTGSKLEKISITLALEEIDNLPNNIKHRRKERHPYPIGGYIDSTAIQESFSGRIKISGIRSIEDDLYEFEIRVKNVTDEVTAINLMREINVNMNILSDYLRYEKSLANHERKQVEKMYEKYSILRERLTNNTIYKKKTYGLFIDYNALDQMSEEEKRQLLMNMR